MTGPADAPHTSVLLDEVVESLNLAPGRSVVDGTFGAGGYSRAFLSAGANVIAIDVARKSRKFGIRLSSVRRDVHRDVQRNQ